MRHRVMNFDLLADADWQTQTCDREQADRDVLPNCVPQNCTTKIGTRSVHVSSRKKVVYCKY